MLAQVARMLASALNMSPTFLTETGPEELIRRNAEAMASQTLDGTP